MSGQHDASSPSGPHSKLQPRTSSPRKNFNAQTVKAGENGNTISSTSNKESSGSVSQQHIYYFHLKSLLSAEQRASLSALIHSKITTLQRGSLPASTTRSAAQEHSVQSAQDPRLHLVLANTETLSDVLLSLRKYYSGQPVLLEKVERWLLQDIVLEFFSADIAASELRRSKNKNANGSPQNPVS